MKHKQRREGGKNIQGPFTYLPSIDLITVIVNHTKPFVRIKHINYLFIC